MHILTQPGNMSRFLKDSSYGFTAKLVCACAVMFPRKVALSLGALLGSVAYRFASEQRALAEKNLNLSLELKDGTSAKRIVRRCFRNLGKNLIEFIRFPHTSSEKNREIVTFEGKTHIDGALAEGKGAIILTGHFGNWELLAASLVEQVAPLTPIARRLRSQRLDALISGWRRAAGYSTIDRDSAARDILRCLNRNELIGVLADVDTSVDGVFVDFMGRPAHTPYSPVAIALKTGAAVLPTFIIRQPDDSHRVVVEPPLNLKRTGDRDRDFIINTQMFTEIIESYVRRYPEQWIWMHERWKKQPGDVIDS